MCSWVPTLFLLGTSGVRVSMLTNNVCCSTHWYRRTVQSAMHSSRNGLQVFQNKSCFNLKIIQEDTPTSLPCVQVEHAARMHALTKHKCGCRTKWGELFYHHTSVVLRKNRTDDHAAMPSMSSAGFDSSPSAAASKTKLFADSSVCSNEMAS